MSQQPPYEPASGAGQAAGYPQGRPAYGQPAYGQGGSGYPPAGPQKTNTMAILGLVFAFLFQPLGIIFSAIGLSQIKQTREKGRGLALAGLILSIVFMILGLVLFFFVLAALNEVVEQTVSAFGTDMATVTTPEEYVAVDTQTRTAIEGAAAGATGPMCVEDVQVLSDDLQLTAAAAGEDPSYPGLWAILGSNQ